MMIKEEWVDPVSPDFLGENILLLAEEIQREERALLKNNKTTAVTPTKKCLERVSHWFEKLHRTSPQGLHHT